MFTIADLVAVGCELNGVYYLNGQTFQPNPLYKCLCVSGAIGCTPVFTPKLAKSPCTRHAGRKKPGQSICGPGKQKQLQSTNYRLMSGVSSYPGKRFCARILLHSASLAPAARLPAPWQFGNLSVFAQGHCQGTGLSQLTLLLLGDRFFSLNPRSMKSKNSFGFCQQGIGRSCLQPIFLQSFTAHQIRPIRGAGGQPFSSP